MRKGMDVCGFYYRAGKCLMRNEVVECAESAISCKLMK